MKKIYELTGWNFDNIIKNIPDLNVDEWVEDYPITFPTTTINVDPNNDPPKCISVVCDDYIVEFFPLESFNYREMCIIPKFEYDTLIEELEGYKILYKQS